MLHPIPPAAPMVPMMPLGPAVVGAIGYVPEFGPEEQLLRSLLPEARAFLRSMAGREHLAGRPVAAGEQFFTVCDALLHRFARERGVPAADLDDCVQDSLEHVVLALGAFHVDLEHGSICAWIRTIIRNAASNLERTRSRRHEEATGAEPPSAAAGPRSDPLACAENNELSLALGCAMVKLKTQIADRDYRIIERCLGDRQRPVDVAAEMGLNGELVRAVCTRGRRWLREPLAQFGSTPPAR